MDDKKKEWLQQLSRRAVARDALDQRRQQKEAVLAKLNRDIGDNMTKLFEDMNLEVSAGKKKQKVLSYSVRDQTLEFDLDEMQEGYALESDEDLAKHLEAARMVSDFARELEVEVDELDENGNPTGKKVPLFSKEELTEELYQPLVRQGLLAETFVPDEFSKTREMIQGSFEAYAERLKQDKKSGPKRFFDENFGVAQAFVAGAVTLTGSVLTLEELSTQSMEELEEDLKKSPIEELEEQIEDLKEGDLEAITDVVGIGVDLLVKTKEGYDDINGRDKGEKVPVRAKTAPKVAQLALAGIASELGAALNEAGFGMLGSSTFGAVVKAADLAKALAADPLTAQVITTAAQKIADGYKATLLACDAGLDDSKAILTDAGNKMANKFTAALKVDQVVAELTKPDDKIDFGKVIDMFTKAGAQAAAAGKTPGLLGLLSDPVKGPAVKKKADEKITAEFEREMKEADQQAKEEMKKLEDPKLDSSIRAGLLEKKIASLQRQQMLLKWAFSLGSAGMDVAAKALGPLAIAGCLVRLAQNLMEAVKRTRDFLNWCHSHRDMLLAASAYSAPVSNFVDNAQLQVLHYQINVVIEVIKLAGAIAETTGIPQAVAIGKAMQATASAMGALEAFLYECKKRYDLERAWTTYKRAILRPDNRKLALIAMKKNPTLAKYAVAWGAIIKKDPLVADFMSSCGLDERTLSDPHANLDRVVKYLELRMPDDNVVTGREVAVTDWAPARIELTLACWALAKKKGEQKAGLIPEPTRGIDAALSRFESLWKQVEPKAKTNTASIQEVNDVKTILSTLAQELNGYRPMRTVEKKAIHHREMQDVVNEFKKQVAQRLQIVNGWQGV